MKNYEFSYIISPEFTLEEAEAKTKELETKIQAKEGVIIKSEKPSAKTLSYPVNKFSSGFFTTIEFQAEPEAMVVVKDEFIKDSKVLRLMVLVKNPARKIKERRQRIKPVLDTIVQEVKEKVIEPVKEVIEEIAKPEAKEEKAKEEKKAAVKKAKAEKTKEKADIEDIDKKLDEILSE